MDELGGMRFTRDEMDQGTEPTGEEEITVEAALFTQPTGEVTAAADDEGSEYPLLTQPPTTGG